MQSPSAGLAARYPAVLREASSLPAAVAYYTWTSPIPGPTSDYFQLYYELNGSVAEKVLDISVANGDAQIGKSLGKKENCPGKQQVGEPVDVASGNVYYNVTDYVTAGQNPLFIHTVLQQPRQHGD